MKLKLLVPVVAALALSAASLSAVAVSTADRAGEAASPTPERIMVAGPNTRWVYVNRGEIVKIVANGQEFTLNFDSVPQSPNLDQIAPQSLECIKPWPFEQPPFGRCPDR